MDVWETLRIVLRRWTVSVPLAVLTIVAVVAIPSDVGQEYTSDASLVFLPPNTREIETEDGFAALEQENAFINQSGPVAAMTRLIQISLTSPSVRALVEAEGLEPEYELIVDRGDPIMQVTVTAGSPALATGTVDYVLGLIDRDLTERQDLVEAPETQRIGTQIISDTSPALASAGAATRLRLIILVVGLAFAVGAALLVEGAAGWAARRRAEGWGGSGGQDAGLADPDGPAPGGATAPAPAEAVVETVAQEAPVETAEQVEEPELVPVEAVEAAPEPTTEVVEEVAAPAEQPKQAGSGQRPNRRAKRPANSQGNGNAKGRNGANRNRNGAKQSNRSAKSGGQGQTDASGNPGAAPVEAAADRTS